MSGIESLRAFLRSPHHAWLALLTIGAGLATAGVPGLIAGAAAYGLGWVFLPDSRLFKRWAAKRAHEKRAGSASETAEDFIKRREEIYRRLSAENRRAYDEIAASAEAIRGSFESEGDRNQLGRLGQLVWTHLRLLLTKETLTNFLETESSAAIDRQLESLDKELVDLQGRLRELEEAGRPDDVSGVQRVLQSKESRLESLRTHREYVRKAEDDLALTRAEIDRIYDAIRLIKADLVARGDPNALAAEIDRSTSHFTHTRDWLRDLEFDTTPADIADEVTAVAPLRVAE